MDFDRLRKHMQDREREAAAKKKGGGGLKPWERDKFKIVVGEDAMVRFLPLPEGSDPYVRKFHWPQGGGPKTCTAEIAEFGGKCVYCFFDQDHKDRQRKEAEAAKASGREHKKMASRLGLKSVTVMEVIDFRYYHVIPGESAGEQAMVRCNVDGPDGDADRCEHCASGDPSIAARQFGGGRQWELKDDQLAQIFAAHTALQKICVHQDDKGNVCQKETYVVELLCRNCNNPLVDSEKVRRMPARDIEKELKKTPRCGSCGTVDYPVPISACKSGSHDAVRGTIFDKTLVVSCTGETKQLFGTKETYEEKILSFDVKSEPFLSIGESLASWGFSDKEIEDFCKPQDLHWKYRPEYIDPKKYGSSDDHVGLNHGYVAAVLDSQAEVLKQSNPYQDSRKAADNGAPKRVFRRT